MLEERLVREEVGQRITSADELRAFFEACDRSQPLDREPDWEEHRKLIARSRIAGLDVT